MRIDAKLAALVEPVVKALDLQLWGIEYLTHNNRKVIRIYIDHEDGVTLLNCEEVSRQLSGVFDVEEPVAGDYVLEVSSPGMDRPLFNGEQYLAYVGQNAKVKLRHSFEGRRNFKGVISGVENNELRLLVDQHEYFLPIESIEKANIVPRFD